MKDFREYQKFKFVTNEGSIANGDFVYEHVTIRTADGYLNDSNGEDGDSLPAIETHDGSHIEHWKNGVLHCENAPAVVDLVDKYELWFFDGKEVNPGAENDRKRTE